jgi:hypothetical protein
VVRGRMTARPTRGMPRCVRRRSARSAFWGRDTGSRLRRRAEQ